ncbi:MAG: S41 family peptidase [Clostridia bacterium]|nr:S41 family peptidase [Clostridia bacterium]
MVSKKFAALLCAVLVVITAAGTFVLSSVYLNIQWVLDQSKVVVDKSANEFYVNNARLKQLYEKARELYYYYYSDADADAGAIMAEGALHGAAAALAEYYDDRYTEFFSAPEYDEYKTQQEGFYAGVGIRIAYDPAVEGCVISQVFRRSPAEEAGARQGDVLVRAQSESDAEWVELKGLQASEIVPLIEGENGTEVRIVTRRAGEENELRMIRGEVQVDQVSWRMMNETIAVIKIDAFSGNASELFDFAVTESIDDGAKGIIIDLRGNGGGGLDVVRKICNRILPKGVMMESRKRDGTATKYELDGKQMIEIPLVALVNGGTASAAEVMAAAMRDLAGAKLVGEKTFGKGIMQEFFSFDGGAQFKFTSQEWFTPKGDNIHGKGLTPDFVVELPENLVYLTDEKDTQLKKALEILFLPQLNLP